MDRGFVVVHKNFNGRLYPFIARCVCSAGESYAVGGDAVKRGYYIPTVKEDKDVNIELTYSTNKKAWEKGNYKIKKNRAEQQTI